MVTQAGVGWILGYVVEGEGLRRGKPVFLLPALRTHATKYSYDFKARPRENNVLR